MQSPSGLLSPPLPSKKLKGVILLTDNRENNPQEHCIPNDFRCSGFKQTQVDPLEFPKNQPLAPEEELINQLAKRVGHLEERVRALQQLSGFQNLKEEKSSPKEPKKNRRKFCELQRNHMCDHCGKAYGSETSLKHHIKLKHQPVGQEEAEENDD